MLHIIGLVLKFIGILLLVILGILVLLVCAVLFAGLRYRFKASCDGKIDSLQADLSAFWLFRLVRAEVHVAGTTVTYIVKIAWKKIVTSETDHQTKEPEAVMPDSLGDEPPMFSKASAASELPEKQVVEKQASEKQVAEKQASEKAADCTEHNKSTEYTKKVKNAGSIEKQPGVSKKRGILRKIAEKIRAWYKKIKYTFRKICDNIKLLLQKKETLLDFIEDPVHRLAFTKVKGELFRFLKRFKPDKLSAELAFGFEDPYLTGKTLAFFAMLYPFLGQSISVTPDFEQKILKGKVSAKGHFRVSYVAAAGIRLLLHKPTRVTVGHIRNFKW